MCGRGTGGGMWFARRRGRWGAAAAPGHLLSGFWALWGWWCRCGPRFFSCGGRAARRHVWLPLQMTRSPPPRPPSVFISVGRCDLLLCLPKFPSIRPLPARQGVSTYRTSHAPTQTKTNCILRTRPRRCASNKQPELEPGLPRLVNPAINSVMGVRDSLCIWSHADTLARTPSPAGRIRSR